MKSKPFFKGYRPEFYFRTKHTETSAERSFRLDIERMVANNKRFTESTLAPKETESHAPICPRCKLPMKKGTHHKFECVDGCGEWCFEESEEGNNQ